MKEHFRKIGIHILFAFGKYHKSGGFLAVFRDTISSVFSFQWFEQSSCDKNYGITRYKSSIIKTIPMNRWIQTYYFSKSQNTKWHERWPFERKEFLIK